MTFWFLSKIWYEIGKHLFDGDAQCYELIHDVAIMLNISRLD
jgi:hypothetical protein